MSTANGIRSVSRRRLLALLLLAAAIVCSVVAAFTREDPLVEGAYLNRSVGAPVYSGVFSGYGDNMPSHALTGVAAGLMLAALLVALSLARRTAPAPPAPARDPGR